MISSAHMDTYKREGMHPQKIRDVEWAGERVSPWSYHRLSSPEGILQQRDLWERGVRGLRRLRKEGFNEGRES